MKLDNKILRTEFENQSYVIIVLRDGVKKYVSKNHNFDFTVKLNSARRFNTLESAEKFADTLTEQSEVREVIQKLLLRT